MSTEYVERSRRHHQQDRRTGARAARHVAPGSPLEEVEAALGEQTGAELEDGRLVGLGLTLRPTPHPVGDLADVRSAICRHGRFFPSAPAAGEWVAEHRVGEIRPVEEAFALDAAVVTPVGWAAR